MKIYQVHLFAKYLIKMAINFIYYFSRIDRVKYDENFSLDIIIVHSFIRL